MLNFNAQPQFNAQPTALQPMFQTSVQPIAQTDLLANRFMITQQLKNRNTQTTEPMGYAPPIMQPKRNLSTTSSFLTNSSFGGFF